jgi:8-oxo-dGTP pyrophosphatase MutT (NUDIX family)
MNRLTSFTHNPELHDRLQRHLAAFRRREIPRQRRRAAAVCITVCRDDDEAVVIVTRRSPSLRAHSAQWALPGGRRDAGETAVEAALRELHEEVELRASSADVLGVLDDYATRSGYVITPVVLWSEVDWRELRPNPDEVDLLRPFPLRELARRDSPVLQHIEESEHPVLSMRFHDDAIYAPTGAMLYQFREVALLGRSTRVAQFEQPRFAWR